MASRVRRRVYHSTGIWWSGSVICRASSAEEEAGAAIFKVSKLPSAKEMLNKAFKDIMNDDI
jgi:hypothetical protein